MGRPPKSKGSLANKLKDVDLKTKELVLDHSIDPKTDFQKLGKASRRKGSSYERVLARIFSEELEVDAKRGIGQQRGSGEVPDVIGVHGWWIEAKRRKTTLSLSAALEQANKDLNAYLLRAQMRKVPPIYNRAVVIHRLNGEKDVCSMTITTFITLLKQIEKLKAEVAMSKIGNTNG